MNYIEFYKDFTPTECLEKSQCVCPVSLMLFSNFVVAQLYSPSTTLITGNYLGIGVPLPNASLQLKDYSNNFLVGGVLVPIIRLQSTDLANAPFPTYFWDFRMDNSSKLAFWRHSSTNTTPIKELSFGTNYVKVHGHLKVGDKAEYGAGITPDGTQGYYMSLGLKQVSTSGGWFGSGVTLFATSTGEFQLMTNSSGAVNGTANMLNQVQFMVHHSGVSVNTTNLPTGYALAVDGDAIFSKVVIKTTNTWPDYVFAKNYNLRSLTEVKAFITQNGHLPDVPSAKQVEEHGVNVGEMNGVLLKKVEELTLYLLELEERLAKMESKQ